MHTQAVSNIRPGGQESILGGGALVFREQSYFASALPERRSVRGDNECIDTSPAAVGSARKTSARHEKDCLVLTGWFASVLPSVGNVGVNPKQQLDETG